MYVNLEGEGGGCNGGHVACPLCCCLLIRGMIQLVFVLCAWLFSIDVV